MIYIAHRANINGSNPSKENHPDYISQALNLGFDVEIDVWYIGDKFILGHDSPQYEVKEHYLHNKHFWLHAKNLETISKLNEMSKNIYINCFYHNNDSCTLTSKGWIWTYPGNKIYNNTAIVVMPEIIKTDYNWFNAGGICSDYIAAYKGNWDFKPSFENKKNI